MNLKHALLILVFVTLTAVVTRQAVSQEGSGPEMKQPDPQEMQEMMAKWMATMKPGKHHKLLDPMVGEWNTVTRVWWGGPGTPAVETKGTTSRKWVLDGRFILQEHKGEMMMPDAGGGMKPVPHSGIGLTGYDNYRNLFVGSWCDNMNTGMLTFKGAADPSGTLFTYYGEMDEPMLNVTGRMIKYQTRVIDKNKHVFTIYDLHAGDDYKVIEVTYTRKQ